MSKVTLKPKIIQYNILFWNRKKR